MHGYRTMPSSAWVKVYVLYLNLEVGESLFEQKFSWVKPAKG